MRQPVNLIRRRRGGFLGLAVVLLLVTEVGGMTASGAILKSSRSAASRDPQRLASLLSPHEAYSEASTTSQPLALIAPQRPLTGERTVLPVLGGSSGTKGTRWLHVMLPGRPNGRTGWINAQATLATTTSFSIEVDTATRELTVYQFGRAVRSAPVMVGKPSTPTPIGRFFVEEVVELSKTAVGAPYAFALSARSNVLQEFDGGPGQIALHGFANIGGVPGTAGSHGCVRLEVGMLNWMVTRIGPGVPVTITS